MLTRASLDETVEIMPEKDRKCLRRCQMRLAISRKLLTMAGKVSGKLEAIYEWRQTAASEKEGPVGSYEISTRAQSSNI